MFFSKSGPPAREAAHPCYKSSHFNKNIVYYNHFQNDSSYPYEKKNNGWNLIQKTIISKKSDLELYISIVVDISKAQKRVYSIWTDVLSTTSWEIIFNILHQSILLSAVILLLFNQE